MRIHRGPKNVCTECDKSFRYSSQLKAHKTIHTQERNHSCNQCGKDFCHKETMRRYMKLPEELNSVKNPNCDYCGKCAK